MAKLSPLFNDQTFDANGDPAVGYKLFTYVAGSATKQTTYTDSAGTIAQTNPIILNASGYPTNGPIWLASGQTYKFVLALPTDTDPPTSPVKTVDDVSGVNDTSSSNSQWVSSGMTPTFVNVSSFTLPGDQTAEFHLGRKLQFTTTAGTVYGAIISSVYGALTTVGLKMESGALDSGLSNVNLSILRNDHPALPDATYTGARNFLINGGAEVAQGASVSLSTTPQYGQVDMCTMWASGGAVSAGTIIQSTTSSIGRTGKSARVNGATLTGAGQISWRYRMEAADAVKLKNKTASFQINVVHDVGISIDYTIIIRKANAADNFGAVTVINTGSAAAVATGAGAVISSQAVAMGDCSNGIEIEVQAACGAITTKSFEFTEFQIEEGPVISLVERKLYDKELASCLRYMRPLPANGNMGMVHGGTSFYIVCPGLPMRATPTLSTTAGFNVINSSGGTVAVTSLAVTTSGADGSVLLTGGVAAGLTSGHATYLSAPAGAYLSSRL